MGWSLEKWWGSNFDLSLEIKTFLMGGEEEKPEGNAGYLPPSYFVSSDGWLLVGFYSV